MFVMAVLKMICFSFMLCFFFAHSSGTHDNSFLLLTDKRNNSIYRFDPDTKSASALPVEAARPEYVSYDPVEGKVYWTERQEPYFVKSASLSGSSKTTVVDAGEGARITDLAIDHLSRLLFYLDSGNKEIVMVTLSTKARRAVTSLGSYTYSLVLHTAQSIVFWGDGQHIMRSNYDGSDRRTLYTRASLESFINLALDALNNRLYASGIDQHTVWSFNLEGWNRSFIVRHERISWRMLFFRNALFLMGDRGLLQYDLRDKNTTAVLRDANLKDIYAYDQSSLTAAITTTQMTNTTKEGDSPIIIGVLCGLFLLATVIVSIREVLRCRRRAEKRALRRRLHGEHHYSVLGRRGTTTGPSASASASASNALHATESGDDIDHEISDDYEIVSSKDMSHHVTGPPPLPLHLPPDVGPSARPLPVCTIDNHQAVPSDCITNPLHDDSQTDPVPDNSALSSDYLTPIQDHTRPYNTRPLPPDYLIPIPDNPALPPD